MPPPKGYLDAETFARVRRIRVCAITWWFCIDIGWTTIANKIPKAEQVRRAAQNTHRRAVTSASVLMQSDIGVPPGCYSCSILPHPACRVRQDAREITSPGTPASDCKRMLELVLSTLGWYLGGSNFEDFEPFVSYDSGIRRRRRRLCHCCH